MKIKTPSCVIVDTDKHLWAQNLSDDDYDFCERELRSPCRTLTETATELGIHESTLRRYVNSGLLHGPTFELSSVRGTRKLFWSLDAIATMKDQLANKPRSAL